MLATIHRYTDNSKAHSFRHPKTTRQAQSKYIMSPAEDKQKISLFSCIMSSLTTIFAWLKNISLSKEHADKAEATLHLELFLYGDMYMCICHCLVAHSRARLFTLCSSLASTVRESAVCLRSQDPFVACLPSDLRKETDTIFTSIFLLSLGVNCNPVMNETLFFPRNKAQVFTLEFNPPFHQTVHWNRTHQDSLPS